jgi:hypothetical protein
MPTALEQAQARLTLYLEAEVRILQSQEYTIGDGATARTLRRADLREVRQQIAALTAQVQLLEQATSVRGAGRITYIRR